MIIGRVYLYAAIAALLGGIIFGAWYYYTSTQAELKEMAGLVTAANITIKLNEEVIKQKEADIVQQKDITEKINIQFAKARKDIDILRTKFNKVKDSGVVRDIGKIAEVRPKSIKRIINKGSLNALRCVEIASGAELTEKELKADRRSLINASCPEMANPNYTAH